MQFSKCQSITSIALMVATLGLANPTSTAAENKSCAYAICLKPTDVAPRARPTISSFCEYVLKTTPKPKTETTTEDVIVVITPPTATTTVTTTVTIHSSTAIGTVTTTHATVKVARALSIDHASVATITVAASNTSLSIANIATAVQEAELKVRDAQVQPTEDPSELVKHCKTTSPAISKFSPVCSCFLTTPTVTSTTTITQTGTLKQTTATVTKTVTVTQ